MPQSRRKTRGAAGRAPLLLIAGLPQATAEVAARTINNDRDTTWTAAAVVFPEREPIYGTNAVTDLMGQAMAFAIDGQDEALANPSRIVLAYVESEDSALLLEAFGHSVWPVGMSLPEWQWEEGRHWRFDVESVHLVVRQAIAVAESAETTAIRLRLEAHRLDDPLLLPGRNFQIGKEVTLADRFRALLARLVDIETVDTEVGRERFPYERLRKFYAKTGGKNKTFAVDHRQLVFAKARVGQDGGHHLIGPDVELDQKLLRRELEGRFRFGTPLQPPGFQHDVQWADNKPLVREKFTCTDIGEALVSGDHANVFGNDVVLAWKVEAQKK